MYLICSFFTRKTLFYFLSMLIVNDIQGINFTNANHSTDCGSIYKTNIFIPSKFQNTNHKTF